MAKSGTYGGSNSKGVIGGKGMSSGKMGGGKYEGLVPTKEVCLKVTQTKRPENYNPCK